MFPTDSEFTVVYTIYVLMLFYLLYGFRMSKRKPFFKLNLVVFFGYTLYAAIFMYGNSENFKYGGTLGVLMGSGALVAIHIAILLLVGFVRLFRKGLFG